MKTQPKVGLILGLSIAEHMDPMGCMRWSGGGIHSPARLMECPSRVALAELVCELTTPRQIQTVGIFFACLKNERVLPLRCLKPSPLTELLL